MSQFDQCMGCPHNKGDQGPLMWSHAPKPILIIEPSFTKRGKILIIEESGISIWCPEHTTTVKFYTELVGRFPPLEFDYYFHDEDRTLKLSNLYIAYPGCPIKIIKCYEVLDVRKALK